MGWDAAFWVILALTALALFAPGALRGTRVVVAVAAVVALAAAYLLFGGPAARSRSQTRARVYLGVLVVVLPTALWLNGGVSFLLFLAYPQVWMLLDGRRQAVVGTTVMSVAALVGFVLSQGGDPANLERAAIAIGVSFLFSLTLGLWISSVIEQSADRAELIAQLETTRGELAVAERAAGASEERALFARDIHDTLAQGFTSVLMLAQLTRREVAAAAAADGVDAARVGARLDSIEEAAQTNLAEARALVAAFSPVAVHGADLSGALRRLGDRFATETGVAVQVVAGEDLTAGLTPEAAVVLLRSAQEGLANVRKHAAASHVGLRLSRDEHGLVRLEIVDDGVGFDPESAGSGYGLDGLRQRADDVGGRVGVDTPASGGTRLAVEVPGR